MVVSQAPPGATTHALWLGDGSGLRTLYKRFTNVHTENRQTLTVAIDPPRTVEELFVHTLESPSWVAWREVRAFESPVASPMQAEEAPEFTLAEVATGLKAPVHVTHAGDSSGRLFVVEQKGRIRIIRDGIVYDAPFLDISERINCCEERGLFNVAFPPSYSANQQFYLSYSNKDNDTVISRFSTTADPDIADPGSEEILLTIDQPQVVHNGGHLVFGPLDGYLYVGVGDGGSEGPYAHTGQQTDLLLGKIIRIDVESGGKPYVVPASNPFSNTEGFRPEIWALGLRNPWGFAFDNQTGDLYIPDTGHNEREEVNFQPASGAGGENYGWPTLEGTYCMRFLDLPVPCTEAGSFAHPIAEYDHTSGCAIVGGAVYRGNEMPRLSGAFVFADFCRGAIWAVNPPAADYSTGPMREYWQSLLLISASVPISSIGEDEQGNIYATGYQDGTLYLITEK